MKQKKLSNRISDEAAETVKPNYPAGTSSNYRTKLSWMNYLKLSTQILYETDETIEQNIG
jgi:hypothetical protein